MKIAANRNVDSVIFACAGQYMSARILKCNMKMFRKIGETLR